MIINVAVNGTDLLPGKVYNILIITAFVHFRLVIQNIEGCPGQDEQFFPLVLSSSINGDPSLSMDSLCFSFSRTAGRSIGSAVYSRLSRTRGCSPVGRPPMPPFDQDQRGSEGEAGIPYPPPKGRARCFPYPSGVSRASGHGWASKAHLSLSRRRAGAYNTWAKGGR